MQNKVPFSFTFSFSGRFHRSFSLCHVASMQSSLQVLFQKFKGYASFNHAIVCVLSFTMVFLCYFRSRQKTDQDRFPNLDQAQDQDHHLNLGRGLGHHPNQS